MAKPQGGLTKWFKEKWVDISRPKKGGGYHACGRKTSKKGKYPKCVPAATPITNSILFPHAVFTASAFVSFY